MRWLIVTFWIFVGGMLLWQFYSYNQGVAQDAVTNPQQVHFYFYNTNTTQATAPAAPAHDGANVQQSAYSVADNTPGAGSFTAHVTLKNVGNAKATAIEIWVRPYRGVSLGDEDVGNTNIQPIDDNSPLAQYGEWVNFPDLAPGESATQTPVFTTKAGIPFGTNITPQIVFKSEKAKP